MEILPYLIDWMDMGNFREPAAIALTSRASADTVPSRATAAATRSKTREKVSVRIDEHYCHPYHHHHTSVTSIIMASVSAAAAAAEDEEAAAAKELFACFPHEPYAIQQAFMLNAYQALEQRQIGLFESPTGNFC